MRDLLHRKRCLSSGLYTLQDSFRSVLKNATIQIRGEVRRLLAFVHKDRKGPCETGVNLHLFPLCVLSLMSSSDRSEGILCYSAITVNDQLPRNTVMDPFMKRITTN